MPLFGCVGLVFLVACVNVAGLFVARGPAAASRIRDARGARRGTHAAVSTVPHRERGPVDGQRRRRRRDCGRHCHAVQINRRSCRAARRCRDRRLAGLRLRIRRRARRGARRRHPSRASRGGGRSIPGAQGGAYSTGRGERRLLSAIAAVQVVLTVALLAGAALLVSTAHNLARVRPGYDTENILALTVTTVTPNTFKEFHTQVLDRVAALPGVVRTAFAWGLPSPATTGRARWKSSASRIPAVRQARSTCRCDR